MASELKGATIDPNGVAEIGRPVLRSKPSSPAPFKGGAGDNAIGFADPNTQSRHPFVVRGDAQECHAGFPFCNRLGNGPDFFCAIPITPSCCRVVDHVRPIQPREAYIGRPPKVI